MDKLTKCISTKAVNPKNLSKKGILTKKQRKEITRKREAKLAVKLKDEKIRKNLNKKWQFVEGTDCYRNALKRDIARQTAQEIASEVVDGIFLNLNDRNDDKSYSTKQRLLRRIVEKRAAQANHKKLGRGTGRMSNAQIEYATQRCMQHIATVRHAS